MRTKLTGSFIRSLLDFLSLLVLPVRLVAALPTLSSSPLAVVPSRSSRQQRRGKSQPPISAQQPLKAASFELDHPIPRRSLTRGNVCQLNNPDVGEKVLLARHRKR